MEFEYKYDTLNGIFNSALIYKYKKKVCHFVYVLDSVSSINVVKTISIFF